MQQLKRWSITILLLLGIVAGLGFIKYSQVMAAIAFAESFPEPSEAVNTVIAEYSMWRDKLEVVGEVRAMRTLEVRAELEGMITQVNFVSGSIVEKGDLLIQQDITTEQAQLAAVSAQIELAQLEVRRFEDLVAKRAGAREDLDRARAQLKIQQANAQAIATTIARKTIRAPFRGVTAIHQWEVGAYLAADTLITTLIGDTSKVWVDFSLPQRYAGIEVGDDVIIVANDSTEETLTAKVSAINPQIMSSSRSFQVRATLDNRAANLKPGSMVSVFTPIAQAIEVIRLPNEALRFDTFGSYVYVLERDNDGKYRAQRRAVEFAAREQGKVMITSGIASGDIVATVGSAKLNQGLWTKISEND